MTLPPPPMRFGVFLQPLHSVRENPTLALERDMQLLEHLDALGFDEAWIGEHHSTGWELIASPEIFIAAAAARTRSIKLGTGVVQLAIHHPFHVADRMVLLDHLTRGRAMLGVGVGGGLPSDLYVFGVEIVDAQPRFEQAFDLIMRMLTTVEPITERTDWYEVREALLQVRPYTYPYFPVAVASDNPINLERVGRWGARWLAGARADRIPELREHLERGAQSAGRIADPSQITMVTQMHLADTRQRALDETRTGAAHEAFDFAAGVNGHPEPAVSRDSWVDQLAETRAIIGTPDDAIAAIQRMVDASGGFGTLLLTVKEWADREAMFRSYELFARHVMPHFQGTLPSLAVAANVAGRFNKARTPAK
ncbi:MAG: LLM class flavin-dependent oxidoreductase [Chloroflexi bacterium]|nr:LLM class flavin-dependent oxidoreductase [Chloroflexota bacterium]